METPGPALLDALDRSARRYTTPTGPGSRMVWRNWGSGPPLLMLHGGAGSWMHWVRNIEALAPHRTLWVPDLPGLGESDLPREGLDADSLAPLVLAGAEELLAGEAFELLGFSFGSLVGGFMAQVAPQRVTRFVAIGMTGLGLTPGLPHELRSLRGVTEPQERAEVLRHNLAAMMIHDPARIDALAVAVQDRSAQRDRVRNRKVMRTDAMLRLAPGWRCPVFGIWGEEDNIRRPDVPAFGAATAKLGLREQHVLPATGHWAQYEQAHTVNPLLLRLLAA